MCALCVRALHVFVCSFPFPFPFFSFPCLFLVFSISFSSSSLLFLSRTQFALPALRPFRSPPLPFPALRYLFAPAPSSLPLVRIVACSVTVTVSGASSVSSSRKGGFSSHLLWSLHTAEQGNGTTYLVRHLQDCGGNTHAAWACTKKR